MVKHGRKWWEVVYWASINRAKIAKNWLIIDWLIIKSVYPGELIDNWLIAATVAANIESLYIKAKLFIIRQLKNWKNTHTRARIMRAWCTRAPRRARGCRYKIPLLRAGARVGVVGTGWRYPSKYFHIVIVSDDCSWLCVWVCLCVVIVVVGVCLE